MFNFNALQQQKVVLQTFQIEKHTLTGRANGNQLRSMTQNIGYSLPRMEIYIYIYILIMP